MSDELEKRILEENSDVKSEVDNNFDNISIKGEDFVNQKDSSSKDDNKEMSYTFWAETEDALNKNMSNEIYETPVDVSNLTYTDEKKYEDNSSVDNKPVNKYRSRYEEIFDNKEVNEAYLREQSAASMEDSLDSEGNVSHKKGKRFAKFISMAAAFGIIAGATFLGVTYIGYRINPDLGIRKEAKQAIAVTTTGSKGDTTAVSNGQKSTTTDVSGLVENTMPSIVSIKSSLTETVNDFFGNSYEEPAEGSGSGIIVGKNDDALLIATNNHVVEGTKELKVTFADNSEVKAEVKGTDTTSDLAVISVKISDLKSDTLNKIKVAVLGDSDQVKVGQMAVAIGNALGYGQSVTVGYISAKDREVQVSDTQTMNLLQTDAAINPGNSGGALLNLNGEVIGINCAKTAANEVEGMGYAIPISKATPIINDLMNREVLKESEQGYLGITGADVTETEKQNFNMPIGVAIGTVVKDGPADKAGLKQGDIITKVNGTEITTFTQLKEKVNSNRIGTEITITFMRSNNGEYKENEVKVKLAAKPDDSQYNTSPNSNGTDNGSQGFGSQGDGSQGDGSQGDSSDGIDDFFNFGN